MSIFSNHVLFEEVESEIEKDLLDDIDRDDEDEEKEDDEDKDEDKDEDEEIKKEKDDEDEDKLEEEEEEKLEEEEELIAPPTLKQIRDYDPKFLKKFPSVKNALFRDKAYQEIFSNVDEAKSAAESKKNLDAFSSDLLNGNIEKVLNTVKQKSPESFDKIVDDYLVQLHNVDKEAYRQVASNIVKDAVAHILMSAKNADNDEDKKELEDVAKKFYAVVFGKKTLEGFERRTKKDDRENPESEKLKREREEFENTKFETAVDETDKNFLNRIRNTIELNIDKKDDMPAYVKKAAIKEVEEQLIDHLESDAYFKKNNDNLWKKATEDGYSKESKDRIVRAYLGKAKSILPNIIKKVRNDALKGIGKRDKEDREEVDRKGPLPRGQNRNSTSSHKSGRDLRKGETIENYFMSED